MKAELKIQRISWRVTIGRTAQIIIGMVFLTAGLIKAWEPALFFWNVASYADLLANFLTYPWKQFFIHWQPLVYASLLVIPLEVALGTALVCNWRPRQILAIAMALMLTFVILMASAWNAGGTDSCGCFGDLVERSPGQAVIEDLILLGILILGWLAISERPHRKHSRIIVLIAVIIALSLGGTRLALQSERLRDSDLLPGVRLTGVHPLGMTVNLMKGNLLLELISPACNHCGASISLMNDYLTQLPSLQIVALTSTPQDTPELRYFRDWWHPHFPIGTISMSEFLRLTHGHSTPRLALIHNGVIQNTWEYDSFPNPAQLSMLLGK